MADEEIKEEFNVESSRKEYEAFIDRLRKLLAGNRMVRDRPVLPPAADIPRNHPRFEIVLRTKNRNEITLLFRRSDLYLEAYQMGNSGTWFEFSEGTTNHVVQGSEFLRFSGSYAGANGLEATGTREGISGARDDINLGQDPLRNAVDSLATTYDQDVMARALVVVIQMISESLRFEDIQYFITYNWYSGRRPHPRLLTLENNWGRFSNAMLRSDADPDLSIFPIRRVYGGSQHTFTFELVRAAIALIGYNVKGISQRKTRSTCNADDDDDNENGRALLQVFEVIINDIDGETPGELYGTITVNDGELSQYIYNRERENIESINPGEKATLTGPTQEAISALDNFMIEVDLMDRDRISDDDEVSKGQIAWSVYHINANVYDKPLSQKINGAYGSINIVYGVLSNAVQASVEVIMINGDGEDPADVYGDIFAGNSNSELEKHESVLFHRDRGDVIEIREGAVIPLYRSIVAVPLNSELIIRADLTDRDDAPFNPDDEIAKGTINFPAQLSGEVHGFIDGKYGQIKVNVTWTP